ncbi:ankyrin repeat protein, putative, partial [Trichomonas vaginalis G3]
MKYSKLTPKQFNSLLKQSSSTINASKLYVCTRNANVTVQSINDVVSVLKSVKTYMKFKIFDGVIDFLLQNDKERCESAEENKKLREQIQKLQEQIQDLKFQKNRKFLTKITELKISNDFDSVYKLFGKISAEDNQEMMSKACEEGLWKKTTENRKNVLHVACEKGNLQLVKLLIECGCNKETIDEYGNTPLIYASWNNQLEVVKYLISAGANKEAKNNDGKTPLIYASLYDYLNIVKYLVSDGANKDVKNNDGKTPIIYASLYGYLDVVKYLISDGANKETKNK